MAKALQTDGNYCKSLESGFYRFMWDNQDLYKILQKSGHREVFRIEITLEFTVPDFQVEGVGSDGEIIAGGSNEARFMLGTGQTATLRESYEVQRRFAYRIASRVAQRLLDLGFVRDSSIGQILHNYLSFLLTSETIINQSDNVITQIYTYNSRTRVTTGYYYEIPQDYNNIQIQYIIENMAMTQNYTVEKMIVGGLTQTIRRTKMNTNKVYLPSFAGQGIGRSRKMDYKNSAILAVINKQLQQDLNSEFDISPAVFTSLPKRCAIQDSIDHIHQQVGGVGNGVYHIPQDGEDSTNNEDDGEGLG